MNLRPDLRSPTRCDLALFTLPRARFTNEDDATASKPRLDSTGIRDNSQGVTDAAIHALAIARRSLLLADRVASVGSLLTAPRARFLFYPLSRTSLAHLVGLAVARVVSQPRRVASPLIW